MKGTRQRILEYLEKHRAATPNEISRALRLTPANIRYHLGNLLIERRVQVIGLHNAEKPGRPHKIFALLPAKDSQNLVMLVGGLIKAINEHFPSEEYSKIFQQIAREIAGEIPNAPQLRARLHYAVYRLNELNYEARWEAHREAPRLILGHCPFFSIVRAHPEICQLDVHLITTLVKASVIHSVKLAKDSRGIPYCIFSIMEESYTAG